MALGDLMETVGKCHYSNFGTAPPTDNTGYVLIFFFYRWKRWAYWGIMMEETTDSFIC